MNLKDLKVLTKFRNRQPKNLTKKNKAMNFTIKIWELIKGKEKIIDLKTFKTRHEALDFIEDYRAEQKPYKMKKGEKYSTTEM